MNDYECACFVCKSQYKLKMYAHRIDTFLVGWIFICPIHEEEIKGKTLQLEDKNEHSKKNRNS